MASPSVVFMDTAAAITAILDELAILTADDADMFVDLEGTNLCREGSIALMQIYIPFLNKVLLVDIFVLQYAAFDTAGNSGTTLRSMLGSTSVKKYFFDVRNDADALNALYGVHLDGVIDVQLLELATRSPPRYRVSGLANCLKYVQIAPAQDTLSWQQTKAAGIKLYDPKVGGSYTVWNQRPLPKVLVDYCVGDVQILAGLTRHYLSNTGYVWLQRVIDETKKRIEESEKPSYQPHGQHKVNAPSGWKLLKK